MNIRILTAIALSCAVGAAACSQSVATPAAPSVEETMGATAKGGERSKTVTIHATVEKVDQKSRTITLKGFDGTTETVTVGDDVRNLPQVKKGDEVVVTYFQSTAFEVLKKGDPRPVASAAEGLGRAEEGEKPGGIAARVVTVVADVVRIDRDASTATLRGPEGNLTTVFVQNPAAFEKAKVGDTVEITLTEAMAIDVQPAPKN